jgi:hypothetical protein
VTPEQEAVVDLVRLLERLGIPHMVTGSMASSYHGRPRLTHDADVVVDPTPEQLEELVSSLLAEGHYVDVARARDALRRRLQFKRRRRPLRLHASSPAPGSRSRLPRTPSCPSSNGQ